MRTPVKLLLLIIVLPLYSAAQQFGGNPPSIKWNQVNTPSAKVIFPKGMDSAAIRVADIVQRMNSAVQPTIGYKQKPISILLQNQTTISNAYVGLAPFRSEFYLTPEQNSFELGSLQWTDQLAIHEFRHVQQYNNFNVGLSHALRVIFGEGGQAVANEAAIPNWFFEGDAVYNETQVSEQGRGRLPFFLNGYRALWADGKDYSWQKLRNGSYLDYTPDWYPTGYMLVAYGREKYGDEFWKKVTQDAAAYKGLFYPLQKAIKKYSGEDFEKFRWNALTFFREKFADDKPTAKTTRKHFEADLEYPAYVNDNTMVYIKSTYNHLPTFVLNTNGKERNIAVRSLSLDNYFDYRDGKIVYASYRSDARWGYRDYSELYSLDIKTGEEQRITRKTKYFAPSFSPDGQQLVAVQVGPDGHNDLHLLSAFTGKLNRVILNKNRLFFTYPKFFNARQLVSAVRNKAGMMSLAMIDIETGEIKYLLPFSYQPIGFLNVNNGDVYFTATSGISDRTFKINPENGKLWMLDETNTTNQYEPAASHTKLTTVHLTSYGYQLRTLNPGEIKWNEIKLNAIPGNLSDFGVTSLKRDTSTDILAKVPNKELQVTKYNKAYHLFNFHSLIPDFNDPNYTLSLTGENVLNTFQSEISFTYNRDEGYKEFGFNGVYGALFPYVSAGANYLLDRRSLYKGQDVYFNETNIHAGLEFPFNLSRGKHFSSIVFGSDVYYSSDNFQSPFSTQFKDQQYTYLNNYAGFSYSIQQARQNIYPRFGLNLSANYKYAISNVNATQWLTSGTFYLPGLLTNHNIVVNLAHQEHGRNNAVSYTNGFPFSRGYTAENLYQMDKVGVNYHFPIAYPDAGIASLVYFMRIRGNAFYDYTHANDFFTNGSTFSADFKSAGGEIYFDTKWFNQQAITFGFRYSYLVDRDIFGGTGRNRFEFVLPVSIF